jgi:exopolysaccharide production protein ExoZ
MPGRYLTLNHWRGGAAIWVMLFHAYHVWLEGDPTRLSAWFRIVADQGWQGVSVFFAISGYCITERIAEDLRRGRGPLRFLGDRTLRIYPAYWGALGLVLALDFAALPLNYGSIAPSFTSVGIIPGSLLETVTNLLLLEHWFAQPALLVVSWSLDYELGFYLIAALALGLMAWRRAAWPSLAVGAGAVLASGLAGRVPLLGLFPQFALGTLAWLLLHRVPGPAARRGVAATAIFGAVWWLAPLLGENSQASLRCAAFTAAALVLLRPLDRRLAALGALRWLGWVGTISYSLYLVHAPIVGKFRNLVFSFVSPSSPVAAFVPLAGCLLALIAAAAFYLLVEAPFERLRRRLFSPGPPLTPV